MSRDRWGYLTRLIASALLERPDRFVEVEVAELAPGSARDLVAIISRRRAAGLAADAAALRELPEVERLGPTFVVDLVAEPIVQASFPAYLREAAQLAAADELGRHLAGGPPDAAAVLRIGTRLAGAAGGGRPARLRRLDVGVMVNTLPPDVPWIVEPLLARGALTLLFGREGEGKSLLAMALAIAVATGEAIAGFHPDPGRVLYVDAENGPTEIHRRLRALGLPAAAAERLVVMEADGLDLRTDLAELEAAIAAEGPSVLVLDSFRSLWGGSENDAEEVAPVVDRLRNLGRRLDAATLLLHHAGKAGAEYRGSTAIGAATELTFILGRDPDDDDRQRRFLACRKSRMAPEPGRRWLRLGTELGLTFVEEAEAPGGTELVMGRPPVVREELAPLVLRAVATGQPIRRADVARACGRDPKDRTVGRILEALAAEGRIVRGDDGWRGVAEVAGAPGGGDDSPPPENPVAMGLNGRGEGGGRGATSATPSEVLAEGPGWSVEVERGSANGGAS